MEAERIRQEEEARLRREMEEEEAREEAERLHQVSTSACDQALPVAYS